MASPLDPNALVTLEELTISNMWEVAALIEVLEKKGVMKKQDILDAIRELRQKNPKARTPLELEDTPENSKQHPKQVDGEEGTKFLMGKVRNKNMKTDLIMPVISF